MSPALEAAAVLTVPGYHPQRVLEAVNELQPLGTDGALRRVDAYLAARDPGGDAVGVFWVLRALFDVDDDPGFPPVRIGEPDVPAPADRALRRRFPLIMVGDVPLLAVGGYALGGLPEQPEAHAAYYRQHGRVRERPLAPPPSAAAVESAFVDLWRAACGDEHLARVREIVHAQLARTDWAGVPGTGA